MRRKCVFVIVITLLSLRQSFSQSNNLSFISSTHLLVTNNKTTNLIFPFSVQNIDRGSNDILVQQPKGTENIVQIKANKSNFAQTNLSVITNNGRLYSFIVDYSFQPEQLNIVIRKDDSTFNNTNRPIVLSTGYDESSIKSLSEKIFQLKARRQAVARKYQMKFQLSGIYISHDIMYFRLQLQNHSNVSYDADNIDFSIKDRQKLRRTATQDFSLTPIYIYQTLTDIQADSIMSCVVALPKFTLPDSKYLSINVMEKNGTRNFSLIVKNSQIMKAVMIK